MRRSRPTHQCRTSYPGRRYGRGNGTAAQRLSPGRASAPRSGPGPRRPVPVVPRPSPRTGRTRWPAASGPASGRARAEVGRADDHGHAAGARRRDVEPVPAVQEVHAARRELRAGRRQRVDADRRLLALELVDRPDPGRRRQQPLDRRRPGRCTARRSARRPSRSAARRRCGRPTSRRPRRVDRATAATRLASTGDSLSAPSVATSMTRGPTPSSSGTSDVSRWISSCGSRFESVVVEDLGREVAQRRMESPGVSRGRARGPAASSPGRPSTWASADRSAPGGCVPFSGWSSCCGSPSSTRLSVARAIATTFASEIWPASSTNSTSTDSGIFDETHSHDVPAARFARPSSRRARTSEASLRMDHDGSVDAPGPWARAGSRRTSPGSAASMTARRRFADDLVAGGGDPDAPAGTQERHDHPGARVGLARPGRPLDRPGWSSAGAGESPARFDIRLAGFGGGLPGACPTFGGRRKSRSRARPCGPSASIPCSATHSPSSYSDA